MCKELVPDRVNFIPHALPGQVYKPLSKSEIMQYKKQVLGQHRKDHFVVFWINRNARRKRAGDLLWAWQVFIDNLEKTHGHRNASLLMHTDPIDKEGQNLYEVADMLGIKDTVVFSKDRIDFEQINILHNISDTCINVSYAEGFGLSTLEAMQVEKPIIAVKTGGLIRQVVDHRDGTENGVALEVELKTLVGSQQVPYIYEDMVAHTSVADALMKMYEFGPEERERLGKKARKYVMSEFNYQDTVNLWHDTMKDTIETWRQTYRPWECVTL